MKRMYGNKFGLNVPEDDVECWCINIIYKRIWAILHKKNVSTQMIDHLDDNCFVFNDTLSYK